MFFPSSQIRSPMKFHKSFLLLALVLLMPFAVPRSAAACGSRQNRGRRAEKKLSQPKDDYYELYKLLADTVDQVDRNYVKEVDRRELIEAAIRGVMNKLDPYSAYIGPEELAQFRSSVDNEFGGIGIHVSVDDGDLKVLSPIYGTPAYRAGIQAGDRIVEIDGKSTDGIQPDDAIRWMKGAEGTQGLDHRRSCGQDEAREIHAHARAGPRGNRAGRPPQGRRPLGIHVRRKEPDRLHPHQLPSARKRPRSCTPPWKTSSDATCAAWSSTCDSIRAGCCVRRSRSATSSSPAAGSSAPRAATRRNAFGMPTATPFSKAFPMVILVNHYSASASEIVSACLQDHKRAVVMGERTWGKGSVQNIIELENGRSALKLTTAAYKRPSGKNIHRFPEFQRQGRVGRHARLGIRIGPERS